MQGVALYQGNKVVILKLVVIEGKGGECLIELANSKRLWVNYEDLLQPTWDIAA